MRPLKIAVLWHYHQPYYKKDGEFILPWVRLHGVKDYWDLPELFHEFPNLKQTINLVPSLTLQIQEYISGETIDTIQRLTKLAPKEMTDEDKREIIRLFFLCNVENMVQPYPRFKELYDRATKSEDAYKTFLEQDWLDLQTWYNLTWFGNFARERSAVKRLFNKGRDFTETEKTMTIQLQLQVLSQIQPQMKLLKDLGQVELSSTPMYHPILPLLCDTRSALEAMPGLSLPEDFFAHPEDAKAQIENAMILYQGLFEDRFRGMWPSEGSISDEVLEIMAQCEVRWVASDEEVLSSTLKEKYNPLMKFFPVNFKAKSGDVAILFRDHNLSDAIGFVYARWNHFDAVNDFCHRLRHIRQQLIDGFGEECLEHAVVPIILDGENCWEYYRDNGVHFRRELYHQLSNSAEFKTVTCSEAVLPTHCKVFPAIEHIRAGSWINANFKIWIGHSDHREAWSMLSRAREAVEKAKLNINKEWYEKAMLEVYIAEGSDWFWWYGDEHLAENKTDFDVLFRYHIAKIYEAIGVEVPIDVNTPIGSIEKKVSLVQQSGGVKPIIDGRITSETEWDNAGFFDAASAMSDMHQVGEILDRFWFASDSEKVFMRCDTKENLKEDESIEILFLSPRNFKIIIKDNSFELKSDDDLQIQDIALGVGSLYEFYISRRTFFGDSSKEVSNIIELNIRTKSEVSEIFYPRQGSLKVSL